MYIFRSFYLIKIKCNNCIVKSSQFFAKPPDLAMEEDLMKTVEKQIRERLKAQFEEEKLLLSEKFNFLGFF